MRIFSRNETSQLWNLYNLRAFFKSSHRIALFVHLLPCFQRINNTNLFPFRVKLCLFTRVAFSWRYTLKESCKSCSDKNQPTLNCLNSFCFPYRSQSSVRGGDAEEKRHPAAHPCVLPHLHTLHHCPAFHNEAPESARGVEERWEAEDPTRHSGALRHGARTEDILATKAFLSGAAQPVWYMLSFK